MKKQPEVQLVHEKVPSFFVTGVFGNLTPDGGRMKFYITDIIPQVSGPQGELGVGKLEHKFLVELKMTPAFFKILSNWMSGHVKTFEEQFGNIILGPKKEGLDSSTSYI